MYFIYVAELQAVTVVETICAKEMSTYSADISLKSPRFLGAECVR
jgi:hypothetical protein